MNVMETFIYGPCFRSMSFSLNLFLLTFTLMQIFVSPCHNYKSDKGNTVIPYI
ncbi:hypothetical protein BDR03DRAFT_937017 [Suillus americanus]|nr:hypothetical protein BDR03DRAFT_937017 [Suillus americanus]